MKMVFRWFGNENDTVSLKDIKQIPGVEGIVWALHDIPVGEVWPMDKINGIKKLATQYNLHLDVVESVNVHEDIKLGLPTREKYINNYKKTIENLSKVGVKVICYNFMPVFDWIRTDLNKELEDGSTALFYEKSMLENRDPNDLVKKIADNPNFTMPGWEPDRLNSITELFQAYNQVSVADLWGNLKYFLQEIIPCAEEHNIKMAIHPDDPPWSVFGLPRIITSQENIRRLLHLVDNPYNCVTLCSGALGVDPNNNIPSMINEFSDRIAFAHIRNIKMYENGDFIETSHRSHDGSLNINAIVKAYHDNNFVGYTRPDHGRHIWDETCRPGYGLYDRALGIMYLWGIWDTLKLLKE
ncbi:mannonate dehydratase [Evansella sp. AB-P1]|uniref:mannonate dehydratase n=1 Tax=Evansella sp. AB-P1 TaxID=3037653 RepID=UPI00241D3C36|nr:mannonate dehydratase [Evansella sp. AB-P1]MDG5787094.1 mannonate dehydratase [Evansella sp. AB-P1]